MRDKTPSTQGNPYGSNNRYADLYDSNPYAKDKRTRKKTVWDNVANWLGMRSGFDMYTDEMNMAEDEYNAQIAQLKGEDEYNSAQAQAERQRAAGLNPDLTGGIDSGQAAEFAMEQTSPEVGANESMEKVGNLFNGLAQVVMSGMTMSKEMLGVIGLKQGIEEKAVNNSSTLDKFVEDFIGQYMPIWDKDYSHADNKQFMIDLAGQYANGIKGWSYKQKRLFQDRVGLFMGSALGSEKQFNQWRQTYDARRQFGMAIGSKWNQVGDSGFYDMSATVEMLQPLINEVDNWLQNEMKQKNTTSEAQQSKDKYDKSYNDNRDPESAASTDNAKAEAEKEAATLMRSVKNGYGTVMKNLEDAAKGGNTFAAMLQILLPALMTKYVGSM